MTSTWHVGSCLIKVCKARIVGPVEPEGGGGLIPSPYVLSDQLLWIAELRNMFAYSFLGKNSPLCVLF